MNNRGIFHSQRIIILVVFAILVTGSGIYYFTTRNVKNPDVEKWTQTKIAHFYALIPSNCKHYPKQGFDSLVGQIKCPNFKLDYDYGIYSDDLSDYDSNPFYNISYEEIDTRNAKFVIPQTLPGTIGVYFAEVIPAKPTPTPINPDQIQLPQIGGQAIRLQLHGEVSTEPELNTASQIIHSITFDTPSN